MKSLPEWYKNNYSQKKNPVFIKEYLKLKIGCNIHSNGVLHYTSVYKEQCSIPPHKLTSTHYWQWDTGILLTKVKLDVRDITWPGVLKKLDPAFSDLFNTEGVLMTSIKLGSKKQQQ